MLFSLLVVLYIPEVGKVCREIENFFSYRLRKGFLRYGKALFFWLVAHREQRDGQAIRKYTEGGGVASVGVRFMLYIRDQDNVFPIRGHIRYCKE